MELKSVLSPRERVRERAYLGSREGKRTSRLRHSEHRSSRHPELVSGSDNDEIPKQVRNDIMTVFSRMSGVNCDISPFKIILTYENK